MSDQGETVHGKHIAFVVEIPAIYTDDLDALRRFADGLHSSESEFLRGAIGEPTIVRVRCEVSGEKDSTIEEVWGYVREVRLVEPSRGYDVGQPHLTDGQLAEHGGFKLMRDEDACEWCQYSGSCAASDPRSE